MGVTPTPFLFDPRRAGSNTPKRLFKVCWSLRPAAGFCLSHPCGAWRFERDRSPGFRIILPQFLPMSVDWLTVAFASRKSLEANRRLFPVTVAGAAPAFNRFPKTDPSISRVSAMPDSKGDWGCQSPATAYQSPFSMSTWLDCSY